MRNHTNMVLVGIFFWIFCLVTTSIADDCAKAKETYASGVPLSNYEQRRAVFQKAVDLCPSYAEAHVNLADALENLAREHKGDVDRFNRLLDAAAGEYVQAIKLRKDLFPAFLGLGETLRVMGLYAQSEQAYLRALQLKPGHPAAVAGLDKIKAINSFEHDGFKSSREIVNHFKKASEDKGQGTLMGFKNETAIKDRIRFSNVLFDEWSFNLNRPEAQKQLKEIGEAVNDPELKGSIFIIEGHTDNRGGEERNMKLSLDRAESVRKYLIDQFKVDASRVKTQGFGYSRPRFPNDSPVHMLKNRRVELLFVDRSD
ncbi:MAG: OmpA family protein [Desulfomonile tiedjei]|nr:OmpA family protein [Desulfomonile tiedjei]